MTTSRSKLPLLGIHTKTASTIKQDVVKDRIVKRFQLLAFARELLPYDHRTRYCCRHLAFNSNEVHIVLKENRGASYRGLARCSSLWVCAVCAAIISEQRRSELKRASQAWHGKIAMLTFTLRHKREQSLFSVISALEDSYRDMFSGRYGQKFREENGVVGMVRAMEVTHGVSGWHPHIHTLVFCKELNGVELEALEDDIKRRWQFLALKHGESATYKRGATMTMRGDSVVQYIAKWGHEPKAELWGVESEMSRGNVKLGRVGGRTPMQLLSDYGTGDKEAGELFQVFALGFHGRRQLVWTRGLKALFSIDELSDDELIARDEINANSRLLASLNGHEFRQIRERNLQASVLIAACDGDIVKLEEYLVKNYIRGYGNAKKD